MLAVSGTLQNSGSYFFQNTWNILRVRVHRKQTSTKKCSIHVQSLSVICFVSRYFGCWKEFSKVPWWQFWCVLWWSGQRSLNDVLILLWVVLDRHGCPLFYWITWIKAWRKYRFLDKIVLCGEIPDIRGGADKYLLRPGRKQATATKLGIYSAYSPWSSIHFLDHCSKFCKPLKKKSEGCPSNQVSAAAMTSASDEK